MARPTSQPEIYDPETKPHDSYLKLWGTRGSIPVAGPQYTAFGGNTACLEIHHKSVVVVIDAGTGIRALGDHLLKSNVREVHLFFGHTHWDHIIGFPFFMPLYNPEFVINLYAERNEERDLREALTRILKRDYFPVRLDEMKADIRFHHLPDDEQIEIGDIRISFTQCDHPGSALGFKIEVNGRKIGYVTDNEFLTGYRGDPRLITLNHPQVEPWKPFINFFKGCDPFIHESQYTPREYRNKIGWGHSSMSNAAALMKLCEIQHWFVTHHDPSATDEVLAERLRLQWQIFDDLKYHCNVTQGFDGLTLPL